MAGRSVSTRIKIETAMIISAISVILIGPLQRTMQASCDVFHSIEQKGNISIE
jgi:hypothetical protein